MQKELQRVCLGVFILCHCLYFNLFLPEPRNISFLKEEPEFSFPLCRF